MRSVNSSLGRLSHGSAGWFDLSRHTTALWSDRRANGTTSMYGRTRTARTKPSTPSTTSHGCGTSQTPSRTARSRSCSRVTVAKRSGDLLVAFTRRPSIGSQRVIRGLQRPRRESDAPRERRCRFGRGAGAGLAATSEAATLRRESASTVLTASRRWSPVGRETGAPVQKRHGPRSSPSPATGSHGSARERRCPDYQRSRLATCRQDRSHLREMAREASDNRSKHKRTSTRGQSSSLPLGTSSGSRSLAAESAKAGYGRL